MLGQEHQLAADIKKVSAVRGLYVGMLDDDEAEAFMRLCQRGLARRKYEGAAAIFGLSKVEMDDNI